MRQGSLLKSRVLGQDFILRTGAFYVSKKEKSVENCNFSLLKASEHLIVSCILTLQNNCIISSQFSSKNTSKHLFVPPPNICALSYLIQHPLFPLIYQNFMSLLLIKNYFFLFSQRIVGFLIECGSLIFLPLYVFFRKKRFAWRFLLKIYLIVDDVPIAFCFRSHFCCHLGGFYVVLISHKGHIFVEFKENGILRGFYNEIERD